MLWYYKRLIDKYDVISFDVFDTLVKRNCGEPEILYGIVGQNVLGKDSSNEFVKQRLLAEQKARKKSLNNEVTIDEIYDCLDSFSDKCEELKKCEIAYEIDNCVGRKTGKVLWNIACEKGKTIVVISDMYLSKAVVDTILRNCGYCGISNVFVSNECGCNKVSGQLFDYAKKVINIGNRRIIHIGDGFKSDILGAKGHMDKSLWLKKEHLVKHYLYRLYIKLVYR